MLDEVRGRVRRVLAGVRRRLDRAPEPVEPVAPEPPARRATAAPTARRRCRRTRTLRSRPPCGQARHLLPFERF